MLKMVLRISRPAPTFAQQTTLMPQDRSGFKSAPRLAVAGLLRFLEQGRLAWRPLFYRRLPAQFLGASRAEVRPRIRLVRWLHTVLNRDSS